MKRIVSVFLFFIVCMSYCQTQYVKSFDGFKIAYTDEGEGPVVLLTHEILGVKQN